MLACGWFVVSVAACAAWGQQFPALNNEQVQATVSHPSFRVGLTLNDEQTNFLSGMARDTCQVSHRCGVSPL